MCALHPEHLTGVFIVGLLGNTPPKNLSSFTQAEFEVTEVNYMQSRYW